MRAVRRGPRTRPLPPAGRDTVRWSPHAADDAFTEVSDYLIGRGLGAGSDRGGELLRRLLELPARYPERRVSVARAARSFYVCRRTLGRQCEKAGLSQPSRILALGRVLSAARLMATAGCTLTEAASRTGWADPFALSDSMLRLTGLRPSEARDKGLLYLAEAWLGRELAQGNARLSQPGPPRCTSCGQVIEVAAGEAERRAHRSQLRLSFARAST